MVERHYGASASLSGGRFIPPDTWGLCGGGLTRTVRTTTAPRKSLGITPVAGAQGLHSIAADAHSNRIFFPSNDNPDNGGGGIVMMHAAQQEHDDD